MTEPLILNVDDTEAIRYAKTRTLRGVGYRVLEAGDGATALAMILEQKPDLVLLDVRLPDMSGIEVCRIIKRDFPATMVLQVSATFIGAGHRVEGLENGADSYLTQPVEPAELAAAVNALMRLKRAEDGLRQLNETLEQRVAERTAQLADANEQLRIQIAERERAEEQLRQSQKMEAVGQLTGGIAHDFNNLLTGIVGSLELMRTRLGQGRTQDFNRFIDAALGSAQRAATLTHRLLAFARRQPLNPKPTDVNRLVHAIEDLVRRTIGPGIRLRIALDPEIGPALFDPNQMENALLNLVINARDAMPDGGELVITTENQHVADAGDVAAGHYVALSVADTGTGMTPEVIARAFDPFFTTKPVGHGTGLGLSMLYGFIRQSGGHVRIASEPGCGTMVSMLLPRHHADATAEAAVPDAAISHSTRGETVLLVDDERVVRMLATEMLQELGYRVLQASDADGALRLLDSDPGIQILVTDIGLPGRNGRQLAEAARQRRPGLGVLYVTGYAESTDLSDAGRPVDTDIIMKPFALETLGAKLDTLLRAQQV